MKNQERKVDLQEEDFKDGFGGAKLESHYKQDGGIDKVIVPRQETEDKEDHRASNSKKNNSNSNNNKNKNKKVKKH